MRRRRTAARRKNPATTGALIINPRRKRKSTKTNSRKRRAAPRRRRVVNSRKRRAAPRRRRVVNSRRRRVASRRRRVANPRRRRVTNRRRRANPRRRTRRAAPRMIRKNRRTNRRTNGRRRNPSAISSIQGMFKKIPLIGSLLASAAGFAGPALFGALGVIPIGYATKLFANIMPNLDSRIYYAAMGLLVAAFVKTAKFLPIGESTRNLLAVGVASAAGAVAAYKTMRSDETDMNGEMGVLAIADGFSGFGDLSIPGYQVLPGYGDTSYAIIPGYGNTLADEAAELGALYREIGDAQPGDALACGDDLDWGELEVALSGPGRWRRSFRPARQISGRRPSGMSAHAGQQGTRWNWLIKLVGYQTFQQLASLPPEQRKGYLQQLRGQARSIASQALSTSVDADPGMSGYGALMLATNI